MFHTRKSQLRYANKYHTTLTFWHLSQAAKLRRSSNESRLKAQKQTKMLENRMSIDWLKMGTWKLWVPMSTCLLWREVIFPLDFCWRLEDRDPDLSKIQSQNQAAQERNTRGSFAPSFGCKNVAKKLPSLVIKTRKAFQNVLGISRNIMCRCIFVVVTCEPLKLRFFFDFWWFGWTGASRCRFSQTPANASALAEVECWNLKCLKGQNSSVYFLVSKNIEDVTRFLVETWLLKAGEATHLLQNQEELNDHTFDLEHSRRREKSLRWRHIATKIGQNFQRLGIFKQTVCPYKDTTELSICLLASQYMLCKPCKLFWLKATRN